MSKRFATVWLTFLSVFVSSLFFCSFAQDAKDDSFVLTYPDLNKLKKVSIPRIRVAGRAVMPKTDIFVNSRKTGVYSSGAFVDMVDLKEGKNTIKIQAVVNNAEHTRTYDIERTPLEKTIPAAPLQAVRFKTPAKNISLWRSSDVNFVVKGSTKAKVRLIFSAADFKRSIDLNELGGAVGGNYAATVRFVPGAEKRIFDVTAEFVSGEEKVELQSKYKITVESADNRAIATTKKDARIRTAYNGTFLCFPPAGVRMRILEKRKSRFCVELASGVEGWIDAASVSVEHNARTSVSSSLLRKITSERPAGKDRLFFRLERPLAFDSIYDPYTNQIVVRIYNCFSKLNWIEIPEDGSAVKSVEWEQNAGVLKLFVKLSRKINGHLLAFEGNKLALTIREKSAQPPFVVVLDPGHGDHDTGAVGPAGTFEKDHVLEICKLAAKRFEQIKNVECVLTRKTDKFIPLADRVEKAISANGDVFVSMHLNSVSLSTNPLMRQGSNLFYTRAFSQNMAVALNTAFGKVPFPSNGIVCADFHVTRQQAMPAVLIEGCFLSNPAEEVQVLKPEVKQQMADAIVEGVCTFLGVDLPAANQVAKPEKTQS